MSEYKLRGSIHTLSVKGQNNISVLSPEVSSCVTGCVNNKDGEVTRILNLNKLGNEIYSYSEFKDKLLYVLDALNMLDNYKITRVDFRLDSYSEKFFQDYLKMHRYMLSAMALSYKVKNGYKTDGLFSLKTQSLCIKGRHIEVENYDKYVESSGTDSAYSRLEERSKQFLSQNDIPREFLEVWNSRWLKALNNLELVQEKYNDSLYRLFQEQVNTVPKKFRNVRDFIMQHQDCIYTHNQLVDLLKLLGITEPESKANHYKQDYGIEFFSKTNLDKAINEIANATERYFNT